MAAGDAFCAFAAAAGSAFVRPANVRASSLTALVAAPVALFAELAGAAVSAVIEAADGADAAETVLCAEASAVTSGCVTVCAGAVGAAGADVVCDGITGASVAAYWVAG